MKPQEKAREIADKWHSGTNENIEHDCCYLSALDMHDWTKNELLKNATDIRINRDFLADIKQYIHEKYLDYKVGEKVKLVLIKEEEI